MKRAGESEPKYVVNKKSASDKSSVWFHFLRATDGNSAKCKLCNKILKAAGSSTSSLRNHLRSKHSIDLKENVQLSTEIDPTPSSSTASQVIAQNIKEDSSKQTKKQKMTDYFNRINSTEYVVSKMAALDGLPFKTFCTSEELRKLFSKSGHNLPSSPNSIKKMVVQAHEELQTAIIKEIQELKSDGVRFAVTLDEWTSNRNRRYLNINIFSPYFRDNTGYKNLGLIRISSKGTAQHCLDILKEKLNCFELSLVKDIICLTSDGASVMTALGRTAKVEQQMCLAHGIQLGVIDVLYNKPINESPDQRIDEEEISTETDSDNEDGGFDLTEDHRNSVPLLLYNDIISKVREVVRMFRKSPTKNDILSKYVKLDHNNKDLKLILDCKTRWSSLADMITRFLSIKDSVSKALIDLKSDIQFSDVELQILTDLSESLTVVKATVEAICQRDANLITAVTAMKFMLTKLRQDSASIGNQLANAIEARIKRRLTEFTGVLLYLHSPSTYYKDIANEVNNTLALDNDKIRSAIVNIINKHFHISTPIEESSPQQLNPQADTIVNISFNIKEQLGQEIKRALNQHTMQMQTAGSNFITEDRIDLETQVRVEMALYDSGGSMGKHLLKVYKALKSIPPTSVECERAFSSAGLMCNKIRSSLNDESLDALVTLRSFYQTKKLLY